MVSVYKTNSVTRLGDFWNFLAANLLTKIAQQDF